MRRDSNSCSLTTEPAWTARTAAHKSSLFKKVGIVVTLFSIVCIQLVRAVKNRSHFPQSLSKLSLPADWRFICQSFNHYFKLPCAKVVIGEICNLFIISPILLVLKTWRLLREKRCYWYFYLLLQRSNVTTTYATFWLATKTSGMFFFIFWCYIERTRLW